MKAWAKPKPFELLEPGIRLRRPAQAQSATGSKDEQHEAVFSTPLALLTAEVCSVTRPAKQAASRCLICDRGKATRAVSVHSEMQFIFGGHLPWVGLRVRTQQKSCQVIRSEVLLQSFMCCGEREVFTPLSSTGKAPFFCRRVRL